MPKKPTTREHWDKSFEYLFGGNRRRIIKEARLAMRQYHRAKAGGSLITPEGVGEFQPRACFETLG
jgi:hypothetical protein